MVTHTNTTNRLSAERHLTTYHIHGILAHIRVARTIAEEQTVEVHRRVVIVPWHTYYLNPTVDETADDIILHTAIHEHHLLAGTLIITYDVLATDTINPVDSLIFSCGDIVGLVVKYYLTHHHAMLTQHLGELTGVNTRNSRHMLAFEP